MERRIRRISRRRTLLALAGAAALSTTGPGIARMQDASQKRKRSVDTRVPAEIRKIIVDQLGSDEEDVRWEAKFVDDLGVDSLDTVELTMAFEEHFGIEIPDEDAEKIVTVGQLVEYLRKKKVLK